MLGMENKYPFTYGDIVLSRQYKTSGNEKTIYDLPVIIIVSPGEAFSFCITYNKEKTI